MRTARNMLHAGGGVHLRPEAWQHQQQQLLAVAAHAVSPCLTCCSVLVWCCPPVQKAGVPTVPGSEGLVADEADAVKVAREVGFPLMIKATAGAQMW